MSFLRRFIDFNIIPLKEGREVTIEKPNKKIIIEADDLEGDALDEFDPISQDEIGTTPISLKSANDLPRDIVNKINTWINDPTDNNFSDLSSESTLKYDIDISDNTQFGKKLTLIDNDGRKFKIDLTRFKKNMTLNTVLGSTLTIIVFLTSLGVVGGGVTGLITAILKKYNKNKKVQQIYNKLKTIVKK